MKKSGLLFLIIAITHLGFSQGAFLPYNDDDYHQLERMIILNPAGGAPQASKPYRLDEVKELLSKNEIADSTDGLINYDVDLYSFLSEKEKFNFNYYTNKLWEYGNDATGNSSKTFLKHFYKKQHDLYSVNTKDFELHVNPIIYFLGGRESANDIAKTFNTRGAEIYGRIDKKVSFYTMATENQAVLPEYVYSTVFTNSAVPGQAYFKRFKTNGVDFFTARGYFNFDATKHINFTFGHDKNFIGNGFRSLILSDYSAPYLFGKITTKVWKFKYTNIFGQLNADVYTDNGGAPLDGLYPRKNLALHHLSISPLKNLNLGLFESIISFRGDSTGGNNFDINYLNPVIFYRSIEQNIGSYDNAMLGLDFNYKIKNRATIYGQIILDEFVLGEVKARSKWWANKQAFQLGGKYINAFGVNTLDLQGELNYVRPFMYSHDTKTTAFVNYNQPLAHPLGASFTELIGIARYQPIEKLQITGKLIIANTSQDSLNSNYGSNVLLDNNTRNGEYGYKIGGGLNRKLFYGELNFTYMLKPGLFVDLTQIIRNSNSAYDVLDEKTSYTSVGLRWNIGRRSYVF